MRKMFLLLFLVSVFLIGCTSTSTSQPSQLLEISINPFSDEWQVSQAGRVNTVFIFTENQFTIIEPDGQIISGSYSFTPALITFNSDRNVWTLRYRLTGNTGISLYCLA